MAAPLFINISSAGSAKSVTAPDNHNIQYISDNDTRFYAGFQRTNQPSGVYSGSYFTLGMGYRIASEGYSGSYYSWTIDWYLYLGKDSAVSNASSPYFSISKITALGPSLEDQTAFLYESNVPTVAYGTTVGSNGCIARARTVAATTSTKASTSCKFVVSFILNSSSTASVSTGTITLTTPSRSKYSKTFKTNDGSITPRNVSLEYGDAIASSFTISDWQGSSKATPTLTNTSFSANETQSINVNFYDGSSLKDTKTGTVKTSQTYASSWNWAGTSVSIGGNMTFNSGGTYAPSWSKSGSATPTSEFKPQLPTVTKTGYTFTEWLTSSGESCGKSGTSKVGFQYNSNVYASWTPVEYRINYNLNYDSASSSYISPKSIQSMTKTYGTALNLSSEVPVWADKRLIFAGWKGPVSGTIYKTGQAIGDAEFVNKNSPVTLTAQWTANPNTLNLIYYCDSGYKNPDKRQYSYNDISSGQAYRINSPIWEDHSFVGWSTVMPSNFAQNKGTYDALETIPETIQANLTQNIVVTKDTPELYTPWGRSDTYYGIWIKTGKKMKLQPSLSESARWVDIQSVYLKIENGWKRVTDIWVKTDGGWKHEI